MALNDVWRRIADEVGFFYEANFDQVPVAPGVYAWFYPLRLLSKSADALEKFEADIQALLNYDSACQGVPSVSSSLPFAWWNLSVTAAREPKGFQLTGALAEAWAQVSANDNLFTDFQQALLKASIFMPPLYVGKADNLNVRCAQHRRGTEDSNDFHARFEEFARDRGLRLRSVNELIFACVRTGSPSEDEADRGPWPTHALLEGIMKSVCAPAYGRR